MAIPRSWFQEYRADLEFLISPILNPKYWKSRGRTLGEKIAQFSIENCRGVLKIAISNSRLHSTPGSLPCATWLSGSECDALWSWIWLQQVRNSGENLVVKSARFDEKIEELGAILWHGSGQVLPARYCTAHASLNVSPLPPPWQPFFCEQSLVTWF